ncbi:hypothetical protein [Nostoc sp. CHAB 5715]|nr:hypothetical protein [Nostoc sp. CHAB 5715]
MGNGGDEGDGGDGGEITNAQCPVPNAQFPENNTSKDCLHR